MKLNLKKGAETPPKKPPQRQKESMGELAPDIPFISFTNEQF